MEYNYKHTRHLRERFLERTNQKYRHLRRKCQKTDCSTCRNLHFELVEEISAHWPKIDIQIEKMVNQSKNCKAFINNTEWMMGFYERYGYDKKIEFLVHEELVFVVVHDNGEKIIVTCVYPDNHITSRYIRHKYKKPKKRKGAKV